MSLSQYSTLNYPVLVNMDAILDEQSNLMNLPQFANE